MLRRAIAAVVFSFTIASVGCQATTTARLAGSSLGWDVPSVSPNADVAATTPESLTDGGHVDQVAVGPTPTNPAVSELVWALDESISSGPMSRQTGRAPSPEAVQALLTESDDPGVVGEHIWDLGVSSAQAAFLQQSNPQWKQASAETESSIASPDPAVEVPTWSLDGAKVSHIMPVGPDAASDEDFAIEDINIAEAADRTGMHTSSAIDERIRFHMAVALAQSGDFEESLLLFTPIVGPAAAHFNLGRICYEQGRLSLSRRHFEAAVNFDPQLTVARYWLQTVSGELRAASK